MIRRCDRCDAEQTMKQMVSGWSTVSLYPERRPSGLSHTVILTEMRSLDLCPKCSAEMGLSAL